MEFEYAGMDGCLRKFRITGVSDADVAKIKALARYNCFVTGDVIEGSSNKSGYSSIQMYVEAQSLAKKRIAAVGPVAQKNRILVPVFFDDADVAALLGEKSFIEGRGVAFKINADHPSVHGEHLCGYEGSQGQYVYYTITA